MSSITFFAKKTVIEPVTYDETYIISDDANDGYTERGGQQRTMTGSLTLAEVHNGWLRFENLPITQGSTINSARVSVSPSSHYNDNAVWHTITAHDVDDSGNPSTTQYEGHRNLENSSSTSPGTDGWWITTANHLWVQGPGYWQGTTQYTPYITDVIQEIVDRPGWNSGNAICLVFRNSNDKGDQVSYYGVSDAYPPRLHINYTT